MHRLDRTIQSQEPIGPQAPLRCLTARLFPYNLATRSPVRVVELDRPLIRFGRAGGTLPPQALVPPEPERVLLDMSDGDVEIWGDPGISRDHARIEYAAGQWSLHDEDSTNGTWVDGVRISSCLLRDGDRIRIGNTALFHLCIVHEIVEMNG